MFCVNSGYRMEKLSNWGFGKLYSDEKYLKMVFYNRMKKKLDLENPRTFNEKLQWLKLYNRKPIYTTMVDKHEVKKLVAGIIGEEYIIPTLGVWDKFDDIDFNLLPDKFVLKTTHDSGGVIVCNEKTKFDFKKAKKKISKKIKNDFYMKYREWPYKNVKPRIIAEQYVANDSSEELKDYKFFCFNREPKIMYISNDIGTDPRTDFFDMDFNHLDLHFKDPNADICPSKPENFEKMKTLAKVLSTGIPHVRVDFYEVNGKIFFGEYTFFHSGGFFNIQPIEWSERIGSWIKLPVEEK